MQDYLKQQDEAPPTESIPLPSDDAAAIDAVLAIWGATEDGSIHA